MTVGETALEVNANTDSLDGTMQNLLSLLNVEYPYDVREYLEKTSLRWKMVYIVVRFCHGNGEG